MKQISLIFYSVILITVSIIMGYFIGWKDGNDYLLGQKQIESIYYQGGIDALKGIKEIIYGPKV